MYLKKILNLFILVCLFILFINTQAFAQAYNFQKFPPKAGLSIEDDLNKKLDSQLIYTSKAYAFLTWEDAVFKYIPKNTVFFTAINGRPSLAIKFSRSFLPDPSIIETVMKERVLGLSFFSFTGKGIPITRVVFSFPDMLQNPLMLESSLFITEPDKQDFLKAAMKTDTIDFFIKHEDWKYKIAAATYKVKYDSPLKLNNEIKRVVGNMLNEFNPQTTELQIKEASNLMYKKYKSPSDGVNPYNTVWFKYYARISKTVIKKTKYKKKFN